MPQNQQKGFFSGSENVLVFFVCITAVIVLMNALGLRMAIQPQWLSDAVTGAVGAVFANIGLIIWKKLRK